MSSFNENKEKLSKSDIGTNSSHSSDKLDESDV